MNFAHYQTWGHDQRLQDQVKQVFGRFLGEDTDSSNAVTSHWTPRVDIREEDKRFVILADIPGVDPNEIEISMDKGILSIKGERKTETFGESGTRLTRGERSYGAFYRRFALPDSANADGISAAGKLGVLEISIPKKPETTPRRININH